MTTPCPMWCLRGSPPRPDSSVGGCRVWCVAAHSKRRGDGTPAPQRANLITGVLRREKGARCVELVEGRGPLRSLPRRQQGSPCTPHRPVVQRTAGAQAYGEGRSRTACPGAPVRRDRGHTSVAVVRGRGRRTDHRAHLRLYQHGVSCSGPARRSGWLDAPEERSMAQVCTGKVIIPGTQPDTFLDAVKEAEEERAPLREPQRGAAHRLPRLSGHDVQHAHGGQERRCRGAVHPFPLCVH